jgi:hypothetical protein
VLEPVRGRAQPVEMSGAALRTSTRGQVSGSGLAPDFAIARLAQPALAARGRHAQVLYGHAAATRASQRQAAHGWCVPSPGHRRRPVARRAGSPSPVCAVRDWPGDCRPRRCCDDYPVRPFGALGRWRVQARGLREHAAALRPSYHPARQASPHGKARTTPFPRVADSVARNGTPAGSASSSAAPDT